MVVKLICRCANRISDSCSTTVLEDEIYLSWELQLHEIKKLGLTKKELCVGVFGQRGRKGKSIVFTTTLIA